MGRNFILFYFVSQRILLEYKHAHRYFDNGEYSMALKNTKRYIEANAKDPAVHKLQGQCYEKLGHEKKQISAFWRSLDLDNTQTDLHMRLVDYFLEKNRVDDAFKCVYDIESKPNFELRNSSDWNEKVAHVLNRYKEKHSSKKNKNWPRLLHWTSDKHLRPSNWQYWLQLIITTERQLFHTLLHTPQQKSDIDLNLYKASDLLFELDQNLNKLNTTSSLTNLNPDLKSEFLSHFRGQFCLHAASLLFKRKAEIRNTNYDWNDIMKWTLPLLLLAFKTRGTYDPQNELKTAKPFIDTWQAETRFRVLQAARTLQSYVSVIPSKDTMLQEIKSFFTHEKWEEKWYSYFFFHDVQRNAFTSSDLMKSKADWPDINGFEWSEINDLSVFEAKSEDADPSNLAQLVYFALGYEIATGDEPAQITINQNFKCSVFQNLNYATETLNRLDVDLFLFATMLQAKRNIEQLNFQEPKFLPYANMASKLSTEKQNEWWKAAFKVLFELINNFSATFLKLPFQIYKEIASGESAKLSSTLQQGIDAVRVLGEPKMDLMISLELGKLFIKKAKETTVSEERVFIEDRIEALFKYALHMFRKISHGRLQSTFEPLFKYTSQNGISEYEITSEVNTLTEEAMIFLAGRYFEKEAYIDFLELISHIDLPHATYYAADVNYHFSKTADTMKCIYLDRARTFLIKTENLLKNPIFDKDHPLKKVVPDELKELDESDNLNDSIESASDHSSEESSLRKNRRFIAPPPPPPSVASLASLKNSINNSLAELSKLEPENVGVHSRDTESFDQGTKAKYDLRRYCLKKNAFNITFSVQRKTIRLLKKNLQH